jgi:hypothetical protein
MNNLEELNLKFESKEIGSFFDCLTDILLKISNCNLHKYNGFKKHFSKVMICRYLSMKPSLMLYAEYLNQIQYNLTNEQFYILTYRLIPKQNSGFIKYIKKQKTEKNKSVENNIITKSDTSLLLYDL